MTTIDISPRIKLAIIRFVEVHYNDAMKRLQSLKDDNEECLCADTFGNKKYDVSITPWIESHDDNCDYSGATQKDQPCDCNKDRHNTFQIYYGKEKTVIFSYHCEDESDAELISKLNTFDSFILCNCGSKVQVQSRGWCNTCYINRVTRTEEEGGDCCICMENEGRWIKTDCGHYMHNSCYFKIENKCITEGHTSRWCRSCPLCRAIIKDITYDVYQV